LIALLGGHIQASMLFPTQSLPHYRAGKLRPLCIYGINRHPELPNVPAITEKGFSPASRGGIGKGVAAPKGTPRPIIDKLAVGFKKMMENKQAIESLKQLGDDFGYLGPDDFEKFWMTHPSLVLCAKQLADITPAGLKHFFVGCGGADAVGVAFKIARSYWLKRKPAPPQLLHHA
jgi:Tripartite tricarboxylate transporter family receptor